MEAALGILTGLLGKFGGLGGVLLGGALMGVVLGVLKKWFPQLISKYADQYLNKILDVKDPDDKALVLAIVRWVEKKVPDKGHGKEKYQLAAAKITSMFPQLKKHESSLVLLIERSVVALDEELKERG